MSKTEISSGAVDRLRAAALRLKSTMAAANMMTSGARLLELLGKANFNPDQPRVPRGNPEGGQWTRIEGWRSGHSDQQNEREGAETDFDSGPLEELPPGSSREWPPTIPRIMPPRASLRWPIVKLVAGWAFRIGIEATPVGRVLDLIQAAQWIYDYAPYVQAYLDKPKPLEELQRAVSQPKRGYDIHHIVEKTPAWKDQFSRAQTEAPENLVRIPTLKHWELNAWYGAPNENYGGKSPRDYLRGQTWVVRRRVGLVGLIKVGVLTP